MLKAGDKARTTRPIGPRYSPKAGIPKGTEVILEESSFEELFKVRHNGQSYHIHAADVEPIPPEPEYELIAVPAGEVRPGDKRRGQVVKEVQTVTQVEFLYEGGGVGPRRNPDTPVTVQRPVETVLLKVRRSTAEEYSRRGVAAPESTAYAGYNDLVKAAKAALEEEENRD